MTKNILLFLATFVVGALVALVARTALHEPYAEPVPVATALSAVSTTPAPAPAHADHLTASGTAAKPVNTVCPICGMDVDPSLKPATYQGKLVGFGCRACPPKFAKEPDRYGPAALKNQVVE